MLNAIFTPQVLHRLREEIPNANIAPYGGPWGQRVPDVNATQDELIEYDRSVPPAAQILAPGAESRDITNLPTDLVMHRAVRIKSSSRLTPPELQTIMRAAQTNGASELDRQALLVAGRKHTQKRLQSVAITRGILAAGMACGDLSWSQGGFVVSTMDFGMPSTMKVTPGTYWIANTGSPNAGATPISNFVALDQAARNLGDAPFDYVDMTLAAFNAMLASTEYQNQAKAVSAVYSVASLPVAGTAASIALASLVLGKEINITDNIFEFENEDGTRTTGRYLPSKYAVLSRKAEHGTDQAYDVANIPVTESAVAAIAGDTSIAGAQIVRGPVTYITHDRSDFSWVRFHGVQEATPRRHRRAATARITVVEP